MPSFKDNIDREWQISLTAQSIQQIRNDCDPSFLLKDGELSNTFLRLQSDPVLLCRVIFLLCAVQRQERAVLEEDFYMQVIGDAIDRATEALLEAIVIFSPARTRKVLEVFQSQDRLQQEAIAKACARISDPKLQAEVMRRMETEIDARVEKVLSQLSVSSPSK